uniref:(northern house mosquito) hypothetical protein n=1 Tax=Culex pipiens TaxID=7175 RepID=A0A8D8DSG9_CULPI
MHSTLIRTQNLVGILRNDPKTLISPSNYTLPASGRFPLSGEPTFGHFCTLFHAQFCPYIGTTFSFLNNLTFSSLFAAFIWHTGKFKLFSAIFLPYAHTFARFTPVQRLCSEFSSLKITPNFIQ